MLALSRQKIVITMIVTLQLLLIPIILWLIGWEWQMDETYDGLDTFLFFITETGTAVIYAFITCIVLGALLSLWVQKTTPWILVFFTAFVLLVGTQVIKTGLKTFYQEARPYTSHFMEHKVDVEHFYKVSRPERKTIVQEVLKEHNEMPTWLKNHWGKETGYSFPSGHTAFAVTWLMVFILILPMKRKRDWVLLSVILTWSALMIASRIRFGMHYPIDVFVSIVYVPIVCLLYAKISQWTYWKPYYAHLEQLQNTIVLLLTRRSNATIPAVTRKEVE